MRVLVTGAAGFLGTECVKLFKARAHEVISTDRTGSVDLRGDLADPAFTNSLPDCDVVVNCAAVQYVTKGVPLVFRKSFFNRNNVLAAKNLCERYRHQAPHFIHVGTSMMYRQTGQEQYDIHSEMGGEGVYSRSKMAAQAFVDTMPGAATIIPCIIGGEGREGLFRGFVKMMTKFGFVAFPGRGDHKIHMVHVIDVASLIYRVAETRASGFFNAADPNPLSIREWIDEIAAELGVRNVRKISVPLFPVMWLSRLSGYRLLAREQLLMLKLQHVLSIDESLAIDWRPQFSNGRIARDIAVHINRSAASQTARKREA
ncbi:NAD-dependent epimerase/dehydratase family protein [Paraburkholderia sp. LEh10]|uniref:NAD-dependent epimerase/dehydratase family protein n=1 Tax=Paraburkholderia sp. LEh10 TaxID=2821353 RepID=UPI001FD7E877|nr:NAD(P)-dependent oxidoreductase [Paraburkholderia sp. LEh10]